MLRERNLLGPKDEKVNVFLQSSRRTLLRLTILWDPSVSVMIVRVPSILPSSFHRSHLSSGVTSEYNDIYVVP